ncbi:MAG: HAD family phosphatase [Spirochaetia bacterium]|nr:HAD family phosphatase [Spirochaetia bacterium]
MLEYKLICTDIDGTLLHPDGTITERTKKAIKEAYTKGIIVALVSGRLSHSLRLLQKELDITGPLGCFNGSLILDEAGTEIEAHPLDLQTYEKLLCFLFDNNVEHSVFTNERWFMREKNAWYDVEVQTSHIEGNVHALERLSKIMHPNERVFKVLVMDENPSTIQVLQEKLIKQFGQSLNIFNSSVRYIEILARGIDKGHAVRSLCKTYAIDASEVISIGDYYNDIGMFRASGYAVAMDNAPDLVKKHAHYITKSNREEGLALAIESII